MGRDAGTLFEFEPEPGPRTRKRTRLGRYADPVEIGRGGMGRILRAIDPDLGRPVAIKVLAEDAGQRARDRFLLEARVQGQLEHPNVVKVHELVSRRPSPTGETACAPFWPSSPSVPVCSRRSSRPASSRRSGASCEIDMPRPAAPRRRRRSWPSTRSSSWRPASPGTGAISVAAMARSGMA